MKPLWFFDIEVIGGGENSGTPSPVLRGRLMTYLHPQFERYPCVYALAVPRGGHILRIFASKRDELDALAANLHSINWIRDYAHLSYPRMVPEGFSGSWVSYRRYRIPTIKTDRKLGQERGTLRQRRLDTVAANRMDYFKLRSTSNSNTFTLVVQQCAGSPQVEECYPTGYGLSSTKRTFSLPDVP